MIVIYILYQHKIYKKLKYNYIIHIIIKMRWIYILKCEDDYFYVGETSRLYRRFWEHNAGLGGINTQIFKPEKIVAIYKVDTIGKFVEYNNNIIDKQANNLIDYNRLLLTYFNTFNEKYKDYFDKLEAENNIAECMMIHDKYNWEKIRGGKYTKFNCDYKFPINNYIKELPMCKCGVPCDIKKNDDKNYLFFRCAKKNMWENFKDVFDIEDEPCNFYMEYITDIEFRIDEKKRVANYKETFSDLIKKSFWLNNIACEIDDTVPQCVSCNKYVWCDRYREFNDNGIEYGNERRLLCRNCFVNKNEELSQKYSLHP